MWGIDVSHHQGSINWYKVHDYGVQFAIMKAMYEKSHRPDERFENNYAGAGANGIQRGVYVYNIAKTKSEAVAEAQDFLKIISGKNLERGIWLDMEDKSIRGLGKVALTEIIRTETDIFRSAGYKVGIYCNKDWYFNVLEGKKLEDEFPFWIARYPFKDEGIPKMSLKPNYGNIWQYSSKGTVEGISTKVDMDCDLADMGKSIDLLAKEVISGLWGNGKIRKNRLTGSGYDYVAVQTKVNDLLK